MRAGHRHTLLIAFGLGLACASGGPARADQADEYGLGFLSTSRVNGTAAERDNPFAALINPALAAAQDHSLFSFATAAAGASYAPLGNVLAPTPGPTRANGPNTPATVQIPSYQVTLWALGFTHPFELPFWHDHFAGFGTVLSGPYDSLRTFSAGNPTDFYSLHYGTSDRQFKATAALALELVPRHLYFGTGLSLFITGSGDAEGTIASNDPSARLAIDVGFNTALVSGLYGRWGDTAAGLVFRQAVDPAFTQRFVGRVQLGPTDIVSQPVLLQSSLYYEPMAIDADLQHDWGWAKVSVGISYQRWRDYHPSYLVVQSVDPQGTAHVSQLPLVPFHDTWNPRISIESPVTRWLTVAAGYRYRPSAVGDLSGTGNILDTDAHIVGFGLSHDFAPNAILPWTTTVGLFGQYHFFVARGVHKTAVDSVGAPQYQVSGSAYTYGLSVQADL